MFQYKKIIVIIQVVGIIYGPTAGEKPVKYITSRYERAGRLLRSRRPEFYANLRTA